MELIKKILVFSSLLALLVFTGCTASNENQYEENPEISNNNNENEIVEENENIEIKEEEVQEEEIQENHNNTEKELIQENSSVKQEEENKDELENKIVKLDEVFPKEESEYVITYQTTQSGSTLENEEISLNSEGETTIYSQIGKTRMDATYMGVDSRTYVIDEGVYTCMNAGEDWTCLSMGKNTGSIETISQEEMIRNYEEQGYFTQTNPRTIINTNVSCYKLESKNENNILDYEFCISNEGIPLYMKTHSNSTTGSFISEVTAISYSTTVPENSFELPAEPTNFSQLAQIAELPELPITS